LRSDDNEAMKKAANRTAGGFFASSFELDWLLCAARSSRESECVADTQVQLFLIHAVARGKGATQ
jgi:hypothetical protein